MRKRGARAFAGARPDDKHACFNNVLAGTENNAFGLAVNWIGDGDGREKKPRIVRHARSSIQGTLSKAPTHRKSRGATLSACINFAMRASNCDATSAANAVRDRAGRKKECFKTNML